MESSLNRETFKHVKVQRCFQKFIRYIESRYRVNDEDNIFGSRIPFSYVTYIEAKLSFCLTIKDSYFSKNLNIHKATKALKILNLRKNVSNVSFLYFLIRNIFYVLT